MLDIEVITQQEKHQKMLISAADYQRMGQAGIFADKPRVELIDGEIFVMTPFSSDHASHVDKAAQFFSIQLQGKSIVRTQGPVRLDDFSEPEPDIALLRIRDDFFRASHPAPEDIYLLVEVSVNSLPFDRSVKLRKYAEAGIPEYWIVAPEKGRVEVYRGPEEGVFREKATYSKESQWELTSLGLSVKGSDLLIG